MIYRSAHYWIIPPFEVRRVREEIKFIFQPQKENSKPVPGNAKIKCSDVAVLLAVVYLR